MTYSQWITNNYKFLVKWSKIWAGNDYTELLSCFTIYLSKNWMKYEKMNDNERLKFTNTWLRNNKNWSNSDFNKDTRVNNLVEEYPIEEEQDDYLEVRAESDREDIKEMLIDIHRNFGEFNAHRLIKIRQIYLSLETTEKVFFDLYFTNMLSLRKIAVKLDLPLPAVYNMLISLRTKIIIKYGC